MSIRGAVYELCKSVKQSGHRNPIADLLLGLQVSKPSATGVDRSMLGYYARKQYLHILGYLLIDQHRERFEENEIAHQPIPPLEAGERNLLAGVHNEITELGQRCIEPLMKAIPQCALAVNPYSRILYGKFESDTSDRLLDKTLAASLVSKFHHHPGIGEALSTLEWLGEEINEEHYVSDVVRNEDYILKKGPLTSPDEFYSLRERGPDTPQKIHNRHMVAIMCVRDSLYNINQLLYQAILTNKLMVFDEENVIDLGPRVVHSSGMGVSLAFQPTRFSMLDYLMLDKKQIVLLAGSLLNMEENLLMRIEALEEEFFGAYGKVYLVEMRRLDEHLNSFPSLL